jgi:hypothetical protein
MIIKVCTGDAVLVKSREMTSIEAKNCRGGWERRGKDDRKQNTYGPVGL